MQAIPKAVLALGVMVAAVSGGESESEVWLKRAKELRLWPAAVEEFSFRVILAPSEEVLAARARKLGVEAKALREALRAVDLDGVARSGFQWIQLPREDPPDPLLKAASDWTEEAAKEISGLLDPQGVLEYLGKVTIEAGGEDLHMDLGDGIEVAGTVTLTACNAKGEHASWQYDDDEQQGGKPTLLFRMDMQLKTRRCRVLIHYRKDPKVGPLPTQFVVQVLPPGSKENSQETLYTLTYDSFCFPSLVSSCAPGR